MDWLWKCCLFNKIKEKKLKKNLLNKAHYSHIIFFITFGFVEIIMRYNIVCTATLKGQNIKCNV